MLRSELGLSINTAKNISRAVSVIACAVKATTGLFCKLFKLSQDAFARCQSVFNGSYQS